MELSKKSEEAGRLAREMREPILFKRDGCGHADLRSAAQGGRGGCVFCRFSGWGWLG